MKYIKLENKDKDKGSCKCGHKLPYGIVAVKDGDMEEVAKEANEMGMKIIGVGECTDEIGKWINTSQERMNELNMMLQQYFRMYGPLTTTNKNMN